jgi:hypothetical protein
MPRLPAHIRISLKKRGGPTHRTELIRQPVGKRYWIRRDGKDSAECWAQRIHLWYKPLLHCPTCDLRSCSGNGHAERQFDGR